jgi:transcriptional regulator with XRE-family HTH domain
MGPTQPETEDRGESAHAITHETRTRPDADAADFAATMRVLRERKGWTKTHLADVMNFSRPYVSHVENRTGRGSRQLAEQLDRVLDAGGQLLAKWERENRTGTSTAVRPAPEMQLLDTYADVEAALWSVVDEATRFLVCSGSRSRDERYLRLIEDRLAADPGLTYHRILFGPPWRVELRDHLLRVLDIRDPSMTSRGAGKSVFIALFDDLTLEPERFICANEQRAVLPQMSVNGLSRYDTAFVMNDPERAAGWRGTMREAYQRGRPVETAEAIRALPILMGDDRDCPDAA